MRDAISGSCIMGNRGGAGYLLMLTTLRSETLVESSSQCRRLARNRDLLLNDAENTRLIRHIEGGGIRTLLYGGNANFYHIALSEYDQILTFLAEAAGAQTLVIPSAGPAFGMMMSRRRCCGGTGFRRDAPAATGDHDE